MSFGLFLVLYVTDILLHNKIYNEGNSRFFKEFAKNLFETFTYYLLQWFSMSATITNDDKMCKTMGFYTRVN